ncbi:substrate-binding domain-containing protein [Nocardia sp. NPDC004604]|uniref:substrate-binding domain-containing protein n=1 Tax=Nocardia sp. NPDC004604 TaxID=3157013 RepID=UPI0033B71C19
MRHHMRTPGPAIETFAIETVLVPVKLVRDTSAIRRRPPQLPRCLQMSPQIRSHEAEAIAEIESRVADLAGSTGWAIDQFWNPNILKAVAIRSRRSSLYGAGSESGTFDYFTQVINGQEGASRTDYQPSEDDNVTVAGVASAKGALGYFGYSYFEENTDKLRAVEINSGKGCIAPSVPTAQDGSYKPLARPLFIYLTDTALKKPQVEKFAEFYINNNAKIVDAAGFIPMTSPQISQARAELADIIETTGK